MSFIWQCNTTVLCDPDILAERRKTRRRNFLENSLPFVWNWENDLLTDPIWETGWCNKFIMDFKQIFLICVYVNVHVNSKVFKYHWILIVSPHTFLVGWVATQSYTLLCRRWRCVTWNIEYSYLTGVELLSTVQCLVYWQTWCCWLVVLALCGEVFHITPILRGP